MELFFTIAEILGLELLGKLESISKITYISAFTICTFFAFFAIWLLKKLHSLYKQDIKDLIIQKHLSRFIPEDLYSHSEYEPSICDSTEKKEVIDLSRVNYLNLLNNSEIKACAINCIKQYGVGTCGPRGFLGTTENHLILETMLAKFLGMETSIIYSYGFAAPSNAIVGYCKKGDVVFCDEKINFALEQGLMASKALIIFFTHNNVEDLRHKLGNCNTKLNSNNFSKFLLVEGIYERTGSVCRLPDMLQLAKLHKLRVFVDESISFGVLGSDGRGITQYYNDVNIEDIDMIIGSLEGALGSVGSFCAGPKCIIEQQRLLSAGYVFSASLPAFQAEASLKALKILEKCSEELWCLQLLCRKVQQFLNTSLYYTSSSDIVSPHKVFHYTSCKGDRKEDEKEICDYCQRNFVNIIAGEDGLVINLNVSLYHDKLGLKKALNVLKSAADNLRQKNDNSKPVKEFVRRHSRIY